MNKFISKIKTTIWFLKKKNRWPFAFELIKRSIHRIIYANQNHKNSLDWCEERSVDIKVALVRLKTIEPWQEIFEIDNEMIQQGKRKIQEAGIILGGEGDINLLYNIVLMEKSKFILETGVAFGWSSMAILLAQKDIINSILVSVDMPYPKKNNEKYVGLVIPEKLKNKWNLIREPDINGIKKALNILNGKIDLCHYDSDKSYEGRKYAYPLIWKSLKDGGYFISDDIEDNSFFAEFVNKNKLNYEVIKCNEKYVGIIKK
jgi:predicted O-methyltransferase YrrM